jgi:PAS domain S-box-containing protein
VRYTIGLVPSTVLPPLLHSAPVAIVSLDLHGRVIDANQTLLESSGYTLLEIKGLPFSAFLDPGDEEEARAAFARLVMGFCDAYSASRRYKTRSGEVRSVDLRVALVRDDEGLPQMCLAVLQDVTEHKRALEQSAENEQQREQLLHESRRAHGEAEAANRVKDEFLATLSHELRTPLNAVLGWAHILRGKHDDPDTRHALDVIERNAIAQARLIDDLLDVSRIITGKIRLQMEQVDVAAVAQSALESVAPAADAKGLQVTADLQPNLQPVAGDPQRLQQIFWNLLSNAVKFTESGGTVGLRLRQHGRCLQAEVRDSGVGIAPDILPFVFDRFTQADSSTTRPHSGLGLGLAIVRHLVELHGGTVSAESAGIGTGSTFRLELPTSV